MTLTTDQALDLPATTFRTEAEAIVQSHPDAIMTEALGSADPTLFSEIAQLNGGKMIPVIGTSAAISPAFFKCAAAAVGASTFASVFHADNLVTETSGPAFQAFSAALLSQQGKVPGATGNFTTYLSAPGGVHLYDGINLAALAMIKSKSTDPSVYGPDIITIGNGTPGATVCYSFAACATVLKAGKAIRYEGPGGPTNFDSYHDSTGIFQIDTYSANGQVNVIGNLSRGPAAGPCPDDPLPRLGRLRAGHRLGAGDRRGRLHAPVRRHRRAEPGVRGGHDRGGVPRLRAQLRPAERLARPGGRGGGRARRVGAAQRGIYTPFQRRGTAPITMVIVSLGMTLIIEFGVQAMAGGTSVSYTMSQGPSVGGRTHADRGAAGGDRAVPGRHGRHARAAPVHQARQGHAGDGRQPVAGPQLRHQDRPGDHRHLGDHRGAVRPRRAWSSRWTRAASTRPAPTCSSC